MTEMVIPTEGSVFSRFMASGKGRGLRIALGLGLIWMGLGVVGGPAGVGMAAFGLLPIASGSLNLCPVAPMWGGHFLGAKYCGVKAPKQ
ncbi:MAG: DUF2892 domain-containing protein [Dehalococcoidia bacterium]